MAVPMILGCHEVDSIFKTTHQADVPGPKSWGLGPNTVLWGAILIFRVKIGDFHQ